MAKKIITGRPTERNIVVYYFTDASKNFVVAGSTRWYKYARAASQAAFDNLSLDVYGAKVAVVFDDEHGQDHLILARDDKGDVHTAYKRNPANPKIAGTSRDPQGDFVRKIAKSRKNIKIKETPEIVMASLRIKKVKA